MSTSPIVATAGAPTPLQLAGFAANHHAMDHVFESYRQGVAATTLIRQAADLTSFSAYLAEVGIPTPPTAWALQHEPQAWQGVTWGIVAGFQRWLLDKGYATGTVGVRLATIRRYASLATKAGAIPVTELAMIKSVGSISAKQARNIDRKRPVTRRGHKKATATVIPEAVAEALKRPVDDSEQALRDAALMCLLLDHGLRRGEVAGLRIGDVDLVRGELRFYREKVNITQRHALTIDTWRALRAYMSLIDTTDAEAPLLQSTRKSKRLTGEGMSIHGIAGRVRVLAASHGVTGVSPHDCRHYWATAAARHGTALQDLRQAGGWSSLAMPLHYISNAEVANANVKLG